MTGLCRSCMHCHAFRRADEPMQLRCQKLWKLMPSDIVWCNLYEMRGARNLTYVPGFEGEIIDVRPDPPSKTKGYA